jgi:uncharacterized repeat protein (TIGR02543 family)
MKHVLLTMLAFVLMFASTVWNQQSKINPVNTNSSAPCFDAGNSLKFDGVDDFVQVAHDSALLPPNMTGEAWIYLDGYGDASSIFAKYDNSTNLIQDLGGYLLRVLNDGRLSVVIDEYFNVYTDVSSTMSIPLRSWHHVAFTYVSGTSLRIYLDGTEVGAETTNVVTMSSTENALEIGRISNVDAVLYPYYYFNGKIDEVRIWNSVRTQSELQSTMHDTLTGTEPGLVAYYKFNEGAGQTLVDSKNSFHGRLGATAGTDDTDPLWQISGAPIPIFITPTLLPSGSTNIYYSQTMTADGGISPYTLSLSSGTLPDGLTFNPATGIISGFPTLAETKEFTITATDSAGCSGSQSYTLVIEQSIYGSIKGMKWNDLNSNGVKDVDEPGLANWNIKLFEFNTDSMYSVTTDTGGNYTFIPVPPGNYILSELQQTGWTQTSPAEPGTYTFLLSPGENLTENNFGNALNKYPLTVNAVNGSVAKNPDLELYPHGTSVQLTATPATGYHFESWSGDASGTSNPLTITMDSGRTITANFAINNYTLTVNSSNGSVAMNPNQPTYTHGTQVELTASPAIGYHFVNWSGDGSGSANPLTITMDDNKTVTANFAINTYTLTVNSSNGSVAKNPDQPTYVHGTIVQLTATPDMRYQFKDWSDDASGTDNPLSVTMDGDKTVTANYDVAENYRVMYRTAKYEDWALAKDAKGALKSFKRKADKVFFKFNLKADTARPLKMDFGVLVNAVVTRGKMKTDTLLVITNGKKFLDSMRTVFAGETLQVEGIGKKGKKISVRYSWGKKKTVALKADSLFKVNRVGLPKPNLHNVGEELFPKGFGQTAPTYFANGLVVGIPQGLKKAKSVIHKKYQDVQKSMVKKVRKTFVLDTMQVRCLDSLDGKRKKPIDKQQKSLPPDKMNNKLFAEALTLKMNLAASITEKFPAGFGQLLFNDQGDVGNPFNNQFVSDISVVADSMLSCLTLASLPSATLQELYDVLRKLNVAFADSPYTVDTLSFGTKTKFTGVKRLFDIPYLQTVPGVTPEIMFAPDVVETEEPMEFRLEQNYPNPFNPTTNFGFRIANFGLVTLKVYNLLGQEVATLLQREEMEEGEHEVLFDASGLSSGVYFYRLTAESVDEDGMKQAFTDVKKLMLMR